MGRDMKQSFPLKIEVAVEYLAQRSDIVCAYLFGSAIKGTAGPRSDVDVAVLLREGLSPEEMFEQRLQLLVDLDAFSDREVDVVILNTAPLLLQQQVLKYGRVIYERDPLARISFEVRSRKLYFDLRPLRDFYRQALFREIREAGLGVQ